MMSYHAFSHYVQALGIHREKKIKRILYSIRQILGCGRFLEVVDSIFLTLFSIYITFVIGILTHFTFFANIPSIFIDFISVP